MDDFKEMLMNAMRNNSDDDDDEGFESRMAAYQEIVKFQESVKGNFEEGDSIVRTDLGKNKYKNPKPNQAAICYRKLKPPVEDSHNNPCDIIILVALSPGDVRKFLADSDYYKKLV